MLKTQKQSGFSLIELLIAMAIIGILTTIAMTTYLEYTQRARVSGGIRLASPVKLAVAEHFSNHDAFPDSNATAGINAPGAYLTTDVKLISIGLTPTTGTVTIAFNARGGISDGDSVLLVPIKYHNSVLWKCTSNTLITGLLPSTCR